MFISFLSCNETLLIPLLNVSTAFLDFLLNPLLIEMFTKINPAPIPAKPQLGSPPPSAVPRGHPIKAPPLPANIKAIV